MKRVTLNTNICEEAQQNLDTNIYGRIVERKEEEEITEMIENRKDIIIYGFDVVRKELRNVPKKVRYGKKLVRIALLRKYRIPEFINYEKFRRLFS